MYWSSTLRNRTLGPAPPWTFVLAGCPDDYRETSTMRELQIGERVGRLPVDPDLEVEVRTEAIARAVAEHDDLRLAHRLADRDQDPLLVSVAGGEPAAVVDAGVVPVAPG